MKIRILSTSDVHGNVYPTNYDSRDAYNPFGYLKAASVIDQVRGNHPDDFVIYIENGDFIEGSPLADYAFQTRDAQHYDQCFSKILNRVKPDVGILGNHEFNYGTAYLKRVYTDIDYPILAANIKTTNINSQPYKILTYQGIKVGVIGLTTQYIPHWEKAENISGWEFESAYEAAKRTVATIRNQVDLVVVAYHGGFERDLETGKQTERLTGENEGYRLLTEIDGIDALVTGHQHREIAQVINGIPTTQPGFRGAKVGMITLEINDTKQIVHAEAELLPVAAADLSASLLPLVEAWQTDVQQWLDQPIATIEGGMRIDNHMQARMHGHAYLALVNQVQMEAMGVDISGTSLFNDEVGGLDEVVTMRNVMNSYVYPNTLVVEEIRGADFKLALEKCASFFELQADGEIGISPSFAKPKLQLYNYDYYSGVDYTIDVRQPKGHRITELKYHGQAVVANQKLQVVVNQYRGIGGGDYPMFSADKIIKVDEHDVPRLIVDYLRRLKQVIPQTPHNLKFIQ